MPQLDNLDKIVLDRISHKQIVVNAERGGICGVRTDITGSRVPIGYIVGQDAKFTLQKDNRRFCYHVNRAVYLSVHGSVPEGKIVYNIDGDVRNNAIDNLGLKLPKKKNTKIRFWTEKELKFLKENYLTLSYEEISKKVNRSVKAVRNKVKQMKCPPKPCRVKRWSKEDDKKLKKLYCDNTKTMKDIALIMDRGLNSIYLRVNKYLLLRGRSRPLKDLNEDNFYTSFKRANQRGTVWSKCCMCNYSKYIELHHIDGDNLNHHVLNIATMCSKHHTEVENGEHKGKPLYAIWRRVNRDGWKGELKNNLERTDLING